MAKKSTKKRATLSLGLVILIVAILVVGYFFRDKIPFLDKLFSNEQTYEHISLDEIPEYSDSPYVVINSNVPFFTDEEKADMTSYEHYADLDNLQRCGVVMACIGTDLMPADGEERGSISHVYPSGWEQNKYDTELVEGGYLYNRSHLIGWQLTAENDNEKNLITGTRYFNVEGMLPFENMAADYLHEYEDNHVLYRVTPIYDGSNLLASGVLMEVYSMEDSGEGLTFCVYVYNVQPGIEIDYATGENQLAK